MLYYRIKAINPNSKIIFVTAFDIVDELVSILPDVTSYFTIKKLRIRYTLSAQVTLQLFCVCIFDFEIMCYQGCYMQH